MQAMLGPQRSCGERALACPIRAKAAAQRATPRVSRIVNIDDRQLEVYPGAPGVAGAYPPPTILDESASVELVIGGQVVGQIAVADLLPRRP
jgi:hypothetical protein